MASKNTGFVGALAGLVGLQMKIFRCMSSGDCRIVLEKPGYLRPGSSKRTIPFFRIFDDSTVPEVQSSHVNGNSSQFLNQVVISNQHLFCKILLKLLSRKNMPLYIYVKNFLPFFGDY